MIGIVTTTIKDPPNWNNILESYKGREEIKGYIIGDIKTPDIEKYPNTDYMKVQDQSDFIESLVGRDRFPAYWRIFQENNCQRRIIGFLKAVYDGCEYIVALDDDNFPREGEDLISEHVNVLESKSFRTISSSLKYINSLELLEKNIPNVHPYVRGYPIHLRGEPEYSFDIVENGKIGCNIGLWEGDPDIEVLSRLQYDNLRTKALSMTPLGIYPETYTSMCLQNISFRSEYLLFQYEFPMNINISGLSLQRYDDIWSGYICKKLLDQLGVYMTIGPPIALHKRNIHNIISDFLNEYWGQFINLFFFTAIQEIKLEEKIDPLKMYVELVNKLYRSLHFIDPQIQSYFNRVWHDMLRWADLCSMIQDNDSKRSRDSF